MADEFCEAADGEKGIEKNKGTQARSGTFRSFHAVHERLGSCPRTQTLTSFSAAADVH